MISFGKARVLAFSLALSTMALALPAPIAIADAAPPALLQTQDASTSKPSPEQIEAARQLVQRFVEISRLPDIYADWRRSLRDVTIPLLREAGEGSVVGVPAPDAQTASQIAKVLTFLSYVQRAADELEAPLAKNRPEMVDDAAVLIAKYTKLAEIEDLSKLLKQPVVVKVMGAFYDVSKWGTGFSREDGRTFMGFSAWAKTLNVDTSHGLPGLSDQSAPPPTPEKIAKAQLIVDDLFKVARFEDAIADVKRFIQDVYLPTAPLSDAEREELTQQIAQYEFTYNFQKSLVMAAAPSVLAATFSTEQMQVLHGFIRSPACEKLFSLLRAPIKTVTSVTKDEAVSMKSFVEDLDRKSKLRERTEQNSEKIDAEWRALVDKWRDRFENALSPETRQGLEKSFKDMQSIGSPI